jgi:hypothetical protein
MERLETSGSQPVTVRRPSRPLPSALVAPTGYRDRLPCDGQRGGQALALVVVQGVLAELVGQQHQVSGEVGADIGVWETSEPKRALVRTVTIYRR